MHGTLVRIVVKAGMRSEMLAFLRWDAEVARGSEPGTLRFDVWEVEQEPGVMYLYEAYKDAEAFELHKMNDPFKKLGEFIRMTEEMTVVIPFTESVVSNAEY